MHSVTISNSRAIRNATQLFRSFLLSVSLVFVSIGNGDAAPFQQTSSIDISSARERGIQLYNQQEFRSAVDSLQKAVKANKADYEAWFFLGLAQVRTKQLNEASKSFESAI